jgi:hypothetical protein
LYRVCVHLYPVLIWSNIQTLQLFCMFLRVCLHLYPVLVWSNTNPATVLYLPPCVRTSISCLDLEQYKPCNCSVCSSVYATQRNIHNSCRVCILLQIKTGYRCTHTRRNIQNSCRVCIAPGVCVHLYPVLIWSNANPATVLYVPPCVLTSISCLDLEQYKPCNSSVCCSVCAYIYILS